MKLDETLRLLEETAERKSIKVSYEPLGGELGAGGLCKVKGEYRVIIDKRSSPGERVTLLAQALGAFSLDDVFLAPEVRDVIEKAGAFRRGRKS